LSLVPKKEKVKSFFDDAEKSGESNTTPNRYNYDEDWGEKYEGISKLGLFILDLGTGIIKEIPGISSKETVGQPMFTPCSQGIVYTAWGSAFRKMGMIYCYQRPCEIRLVRFVDGIMGLSPVDLSNPAPVHHVSVSKGFSLARSPRFNILSSSQNNSSECYHLVFLGSKEPRDTHNSSSSLYSLDWNQFIDSLNVLSFSETGELVTVSNEQLAELSNQTIREIISSEARSDSTDATIGGYPFPGLYCGSLPLRPFVDKETLLLETQWRCHTVIVSVNILTGSLRTLHNHSPHLSSFSLSPSFSVSDSIIPHNPAHQRGSWMSGCEPSSSIVDVHPEHGLLLLTSTPTTPPVLVHITISNIKRGAMTGKSSIPIPMESSQSNFFPFMSAMTSKITASATPPSSPVSPKGRLSCHILHHSFDENVSDDFESILILPPVSSSDHLPPLLVCPHGGPHSAFSTAYVAQYSDYLCLYGGYAVLLVNYRGSTGYGQSQLNALPGHIGVIDVQDVYNATQAVASLNPPLVSSKRAVFGGSHGGFLTAHMIGQYPNLFDAAALRNPVINVPAMFTTSDIPDWCVVEASGLGSYDFQRYQLPGDEQFRQMTSSSPIRFDSFLYLLFSFHSHHHLIVVPLVTDTLLLQLLLFLCALERKIREFHGVKGYNIIML
jgi:acylaminoacyl-peptidase